jgi:tetratricopeptide (TPR) repeat protein
MLTGFRFRREFRVLPWLKFNVSKSGVSATIGPEKAHLTIGSHGTYVYVDVPGKGTYFQRKLGPLMEDMSGREESDKGKKETEAKEKSQEVKPAIDLKPLDRFVYGPAAADFIDALRALSFDDIPNAYDFARASASLADGAFLAGFLAMQAQEWEAALKYFGTVLEKREHLGELFTKVGVNLRVFLPVSEEFIVAIQPRLVDCYLALAIAYEQTGNNKLAIVHLQELRERHDPDNLVIRLMLAELIDATFGDDPAVQHEIVTLAEGINNESPLHASLMYYRARALRRLNILDGARDTLAQALKKKKGYRSDLLAALRYERALIYEKEGQTKRARQEFEKIYAIAPELEDVAQRLGLVNKIEQANPQPLHDQTANAQNGAAYTAIDYEIEDEKD